MINETECVDGEEENDGEDAQDEESGRESSESAEGADNESEESLFGEESSGNSLNNESVGEPTEGGSLDSEGGSLNNEGRSVNDEDGLNIGEDDDNPHDEESDEAGNVNDGVGAVATPTVPPATTPVFPTKDKYIRFRRNPNSAVERDSFIPSDSWLFAKILLSLKLDKFGRNTLTFYTLLEDRLAYIFLRGDRACIMTSSGRCQRRRHLINQWFTRFHR